MAKADNLRLGVRVRPGASRAKVGGSYGASQELVVAVGARAVDGAANVAVVLAVAEAFGVRRADVEVVIGHTSRSKVLAIQGDIAALTERLRILRDGAPL